MTTYLLPPFIDMSSESSSSIDEVQYYYRVADPKNGNVFSRVPYEKRSHWLKMWNPTNHPEDVSVYDAFNTLAYCFSYDYQVCFFVLLIPIFILVCLFRP